MKILVINGLNLLIMLVSKSLIVYNEVGMSFMKKKVLFISSTGGHLSEMLQLKELFKKCWRQRFNF